MAQSERVDRRIGAVALTARARIRTQAAALELTHEKIAARMTAAGRELSGDPEFSVSPAKVSHVARGGAHVQLEDLEVWAHALETSELYLLGFTWDPTPAAPERAGNVAPHTPGSLNQQARRLSLVPDTGQELPHRHLAVVPDPSMSPVRGRLAARASGHPSCV